MADLNSGREELLDIAAVAKLLHVSSRTVYRMIAKGNGELRAIKVGRRWRIRADEVENYLLQRNVNSADGLQQLEQITKKRVAEKRPETTDEQHNAETSPNEQKSERERRQTQFDLDIKKQTLELQEKHLEIEQKRIDYALQTANKMITMLYPSMHLDGQQKDLLLQALMQNLLRLGNSAELQLTFPATRNSYLQQSEDILTIYEKIISLNPDNVPGYLGKGIILSSLRRYEEALAAYEQAIRLDPDNSDTYTSKADVLHSLRRYEEALAAYEQAIRLDPDNIHAHKGKADALHSLRRYEEALTAYEQVLRLDSNNIYIYKSKADALHSLQRYEEALATYKQVLGLDSNYAYAYKSKGDTLNSLQRYEEALCAYEQAIRLDSNYAYAYKSKGDTLNSMGRHNEALAVYEQARQLGYRG
jgi:excisionase family DNA binding protein